jgi:hypothetical protein
MVTYVICPHCQGMVEIAKLNCKIFRHGIYKTSGRQIPPHASKDVCTKLVDDEMIEGCAKPFKVVKDKSGYTAVPCDYI